MLGRYKEVLCFPHMQDSPLSLFIYSRAFCDHQFRKSPKEITKFKHTILEYIRTLIVWVASEMLTCHSIVHHLKRTLQCLVPPFFVKLQFVCNLHLPFLVEHYFLLTSSPTVYWYMPMKRFFDVRTCTVWHSVTTWNSLYSNHWAMYPDYSEVRVSKRLISPR